MGHDQPKQSQNETQTNPQNLWMLLAMVVAVDDELERVRLVATGIPALVECSLSGVALCHKSNAGWKLVIQKDGRVLPDPETEEAIGNLEPLFKQAIGHGGALTVQFGDQLEGLEANRLLEQLGVQCLITVPLLTLRKQLGILLIGRQRAEVLGKAEEIVLQTLAQQLAIAGENLQLHQELRGHVEDLEGIVDERTTQLRQSEEKQRALLEINNAIITHLDRTALFQAVAQALGKVVPYDRASLAEYDPVEDTLRVSALTQMSGRKNVVQQGAEFKREGSHLQPVLDERLPLIRGDLQIGSRTAEEHGLLTEGIRSYVSVPLIVKGDPIGTLNVGSDQPNRYGQEDAEFLTEVAGQVALAIDNMLAYEEISRLTARLEEENLYLREEVASERQFEEIIGTAEGMRRVLAGVEQVASTDATVLITGETGTGKELIARAIHDLSGRKTQTMVIVNCAALPAGLIESELFGHEKGAFTGALSQKIGRFELADKSTLFLDEIGDLPVELQAKLLRVLQDGTFERVGSLQTIHVDVRVVAATNRDLLKAVEDHTFREDLYYRLNVFPLQVPPLRQRREDIPLLVRHFVMRYANKMGKKIQSIPKATMNAMSSYPWPGNVRELQNVTERAVILCQGSRLDVGDWLAQQSQGSNPSGILSLEALERQHITEVLETTGWCVSGERGAAKILGVKPTTLEARMKKLDVKRPD